MKIQENQLINEDEIQKLQKKVKLPYYESKIHKGKISNYEDWEIAKKYSDGKYYKIRKDKTLEQQFIDKIWILLSKLKYKYLSNTQNFIVKYKVNGATLEQTFNLFAFDNEVILLFICASSYEKDSNNCFFKDIENIRINKHKIEKEILRNFDNYPKVCWVYATNNFSLNLDEKEILKSNDIQYLNDSDISYYDKLYQSLGIGAKYQFYGKLFYGKTIPALNNRVPAVKGKMGGHDYYSFSISPESLLKISYVLHRITTSDETIKTYQRMIKKRRIDEITKFIDSNDKKTGSNFFPNSIIINIDTKRTKPLKFDLAQSSDKDVDTNIGILHLPNSYRSAYIIDGQHRLYGYANSKYKSTNTIPVIAFENLPAEIQTELFVDINSKQKAVASTLLQILDSELKWNSTNPNIAEKALKSRLVQKLGEDIDSPLYKKFKLGPESTSKEQYLTLTYFINYGLSKSQYFIKNIKGNKVQEYGYLYAGDLAEQTLLKAFNFLKLEFDYIISILPEHWAQGNSVEGFIAKNIGVTSIVVVLNDILSYEKEKENHNYQSLSALGIFHITKPYMDILLQGIRDMSQDKLEKMAKYYGAGGVEKVRREFQIIINNSKNDFNPKGLLKYKESSTGMYINESLNNIKELQKLMHRATIIILKNQFGDDDWWDEGVPEKIRLECTSIYVKEKRIEKEWNYLMLIHYKEIAQKNWLLFKEYFTPPNMENVNKEAKLYWLTRMNKIRNKCSHPERSQLSEDEYYFIKKLSSWLKPKLIKIVNK